MGLEDVIRALRARLQLIGILVLVGLALAAGLAALKTPKYTAKAQVNITGVGADAAGNGTFVVLQKVPTLVQLMQTEGYLTATIERIPDLGYSWQKLRDEVAVTNPATTTLLDIEVTDTSATRAQGLADALANGFDAYLSDAGENTVNSARTIAAERPDSPSSPRFVLWLAIGGVLGLAVATAYALTREAMDKSVRDDDELEEQFGLVTLGLVPYDTDAQTRPLAVLEPGGDPRAEALRQLRTNLQFLHLEEGVDPPSSILVTSATAGEGKTVTACNIAIALARAGLSTVLVGADLRRTELTSYMNVDAKVGLTSVLAGWTDADDALQPWGDGTEGLWVLGAGPTVPNPSELLASEQMQQLLRELETRPDIVVIDGAPLLPVADSAALAAISSGVLLVVAAGIVRRDQVKRALTMLQGIDARVYGGVLNMVRSKRLTRDGKGYLKP